MDRYSRQLIHDRIQLLARHMCRPGDEMFPYEDANPCEICQRITLGGLVSGYTHRNFKGLVGSSSQGCKLCTLLKKACLQTQETNPNLSSAYHSQDAEAQLIKQMEIEGQTDSPVQLRSTPSNVSDAFLSEVIHLSWKTTDRPAILGLYKDSDTFTKPHLTGRRLSRRADTAFNFLQIINWLKESFGDDRNYKEAVSRLPKRVIDVLGSPGFSMVNLTDTKNLPQGRYMCLSHCWSESKPMTTTLDTLEERCYAIVLDELSPILRDTIVLARAIGIPYVWIDSLCIIQDSKEDWELESSQMDKYFGSSLLTVIAGRDSSAGLFGEREAPPNPYCRLSIPSAPDCIPTNLYFTLFHHKPKRRLPDECPKVYTRGWVLQEQILSPRVLSFEPTQTYFRTSLFERYETGPIVDAFRSRTLLHPGKWSTLVKEYCKLSLTKEEDKLPALSGLAHEYQEKWNDQYLAGIWRNELWRELQWYIVSSEDHSPRRPYKYRAPTWSWASVEGFKTLSFQWISCEKASNVQIIKAWTKRAGKDPLGSVKSGQIVVRGLLLKGQRRRDGKADVKIPSCSAYGFYVSSGNLREERVDSIIGDTSLGDLPGSGRDDTSLLYLLYLSALFGLILRIVPGTKATYERIGAIFIPQRFDVTNLSQLNVPSERRVITII